MKVKELKKELDKYDDNLYIVFNKDKQNRYSEDTFILTVVKKRRSKCLSLRPYLGDKKKVN